MHRIVDTMVDHYRPEVDELEEWLDDLERQVIETAGEALTSEILAVKRDISGLRRIVLAAARRGRPAGPPRVRPVIDQETGLPLPRRLRLSWCTSPTTR